MNPKNLFRGFVLIAVFVTLGFVLKATWQEELLTKSWIESQVRGTGVPSEVFFVVVAALFASIGLPRQMIAFLGGYAFGFGSGTALAAAASLGGCILSFSCSRFFGRDLMTRKAPRRIKKMDAFLSENPFTTTLLIRLLPAGNNLFTCLAAGVSSVRALPFFAGSLVGYLPQTIVFALAGSGVNLDPVFRIGLSVLLFGSAGGLGAYLFHKNRRVRAIDKDFGEVLRETDVASDPGTY